MQRFIRLRTALLLSAALLLVLAGCDFITGATTPTTSPGETLQTTGPTTPAGPPRWVWSLGGGKYSIIVDRNTHEPIKDVTPEEAFGIIGTSQDTRSPVIIDVRTPLEYAAGHIRDAINIDYLSDTFRDDVGKLDKDKLYIVYCSTGARSSEARDIMEGSGFEHVINMLGGITEWQAAGYPMVQ